MFLLCAMLVLSPAQLTINAKTEGAMGDARVVTDAAISSSTLNVLTSATAAFTSGDVGKIISIEDVGISVNGYRNPLFTTITAVQSATTVTLAASADTGATGRRAVFGTDDTDALQDALDLLAVPSSSDPTKNVGGVLYIPAGHYLTRGLDLPSPVIGTNVLSATAIGYAGLGSTTKAYQDIEIYGDGTGYQLSGSSTILENPDPDVSIQEYPNVHSGHGVITVGHWAVPEIYRSHSSSLDQPIWDFKLRRMYIKQCKNKASASSALHFGGVKNVTMTQVTVENPSYEGMTGIFPIPDGLASVTDCVAVNCGWGGPAYSQSTSGLNLSGWRVVYDTCVVLDCAQGIETGALYMEITNSTLWLWQNLVPAFRVKSEIENVGPQIGINNSSNVMGTYGLTVTNTNITGYQSALIFTNSLGFAKNLVFEDNFVNGGGLTLTGGVEENTVDLTAQSATYYADLVNETPHGNSVVRNNTIWPMGGNTSAFVFGYWDRPDLGTEDYLVEYNEVQFLQASHPTAVYFSNYPDGNVAQVTFSDNTFIDWNNNWGPIFRCDPLGPNGAFDPTALVLGANDTGITSSMHYTQAVAPWLSNVTIVPNVVPTRQ